jgi:hypothetical protein
MQGKLSCSLVHCESSSDPYYVGKAVPAPYYAEKAVLPPYYVGKLLCSLQYFAGEASPAVF